MRLDFLCNLRMTHGRGTSACICKQSAQAHTKLAGEGQFCPMGLIHVCGQPWIVIQNFSLSAIEHTSFPCAAHSFLIVTESIDGSISFCFGFLKTLLSLKCSHLKSNFVLCNPANCFALRERFLTVDESSDGILGLKLGCGCCTNAEDRLFTNNCGRPAEQWCEINELFYCSIVLVIRTNPLSSETNCMKSALL